MGNRAGGEPARRSPPSHSISCFAMPTLLLCSGPFLLAEVMAYWVRERDRERGERARARERERERREDRERARVPERQLRQSAVDETILKHTYTHTHTQHTHTHTDSAPERQARQSAADEAMLGAHEAAAPGPADKVSARARRCGTRQCLQALRAPVAHLYI
jgi:hypothetical protein